MEGLPERYDPCFCPFDMHSITMDRVNKIWKVSNRLIVFVNRGSRPQSMQWEKTTECQKARRWWKSVIFANWEFCVSSSYCCRNNMIIRFTHVLDIINKFVLFNLTSCYCCHIHTTSSIKIRRSCYGVHICWFCCNQAFGNFKFSFLMHR